MSDSLKKFYVDNGIVPDSCQLSGEEIKASEDLQKICSDCSRSCTNRGEE